MNSREIVVWVDERWYQALSQHLLNETVEDKLNGYLKQLIGQLPAYVYEKISREIQEEEQQYRQKQEAARVLAAFHVKEHGQENWLFICVTTRHW